MYDVQPRSEHPAFLRRYPEAAFSGFSFDNVEVAFAVQVLSLVQPHYEILDYGAGRGEWFDDDKSPGRRDLQLLRGKCREVVGCDVDPAVLRNRAVDRAELIGADGALPFTDGFFDMIVSRYVFEHITNPEVAAREMLRVVRPGGWICALTPNKWGYPAIGARLIANKDHASVVTRAQPNGRAAHDVFPTAYQLNTRHQIERHFGKSADVIVQYASGPPSYYFGNGALFSLFSMLHKLQPRMLSTAMMIFIRKR
jgi:SAM-dependent methyltransferase